MAVDRLAEKIVSAVVSSSEPLETSEVIGLVGDTRVKVLYRLFQLRGDGRVNGKQVGSGKKTWVWWKK